MNMQEKRDLWNPVRDKYFVSYLGDYSSFNTYASASMDMADFFNTKEWDHWVNGEEDKTMEPELRRKLEALLGPFGDALFKAMRIKRDARKWVYKCGSGR